MVEIRREREMKRKILVFAIIMCCMVMGISFTGCDNAYANISLKPSSSSLQLSVGESLSFSVIMENYDSKISDQLHATIDGNLVEIKKITYNGKGGAFFDIVGVKVGEGNLYIKSYEGGFSTIIMVKVVQDVEQFDLKTTPFLIKQGGLSYDFSMLDWFSFSPTNAPETAVTYYYFDGEKSHEIVSAQTVKEEDTETLIFSLIAKDGTEILILSDSFSVTAKLNEYPEINAVNFDIDLISPIETDGVQLVKKGLFTEEYVAVADRRTLNQNETITLIANNMNSSYQEFELLTNTAGVSVKFNSTKTDCHEVAVPAGFEKASTNSKIFAVQASQLGEDVIEVILYYEEYQDYEIVLEYKINSLKTPSSIYVNDKTENESLAKNLILYDQNYGQSAFQDLSLAVYSTDSMFDSISLEMYFKTDDIEELSPLRNWSEYIEIIYKNERMTQDFSVGYEDFKNNYLITPFKIQGKQRFDGTIYIAFTLNSELVQEGSITHYVPITIEQGATKFDLVDTYKGGVYVDINGGKQEFNSFVVESIDAHVGDFRFEYVDNSSMFFEIRQTYSNVRAVEIEPLSVGEGEVIIRLPNGLQLAMKIYVGAQLDSVNFSLVKNEFVSQVEYDEEGNVTDIAINFSVDKDAEVNKIEIDFKELLNPTNATMFTIESSVGAGENIISFDRFTKVLTIIGTGNASFQIAYFKQNIENFIPHATTTADFVFEVNLTIFSPITDFNMVQGREVVKEINIYKESEVGYYYSEQGYATFEGDLEAILWNESKPADLFDYYSGKITWTTELGEPDESIKPSTNISGIFEVAGKIPSFGEYSITGNHFKIVCNDNFATTNTKFYIIFTITEYNFSITAVLNVNILPYTPLESVGFYNYQEEIYLSDTNKDYTLHTFMNPLADCQEFDVKFVPLGSNTSPTLISSTVNSDFTEIRLTYGGTGTGYGLLYIIPRTSYYNETEFNYSQEIMIRVSDGSDIDNPLLISSADDFIKTMSEDTSLNKHFKITTTLDFTGKKLRVFKPFNGSIIGVDGSAKLTNLNITETYKEGTTTYLGLFAQLGADARIENIAFEGCFNYSNQSGLDVQKINAFSGGLIAGVNNGTLNNVSVLLKNSSIELNNLEDEFSADNISIGGVVGINNGMIVNEIKAQDTTFNKTLINQTERLTALYIGYSNNVFLGGVAGTNNGVITRIVEDKNILFNSSVYSAIINLESQGFNATGGIAGLNQYASLSGDYSHSIISNMLLSGQINASLYEINAETRYGGENVGGVVGINYNNGYIQDNITRVFVSGEKYVGGLIGHDYSIEGYESNPGNYNFVSGNVVQAILNNEFRFMITSISSSLTHVGSISGNETNMSDDNINEFLYAQSNKAEIYYTVDVSEMIYPIAYGKNASGEFVQIKYNNSRPFFSLFSVKDASVEVAEIAFDFNLGAGKLITEDINFANKVAYMFFYEAANSAEQKYVASKNQNRTLPFVFSYPDAVSVLSLSREILTIDSNGLITLHKTGLALLQVTSVLNNTMKAELLYVFVTNAFDYYEILASNNISITNGSVVVVYQNSPVELNYKFKHSEIQTQDSYNQNISITLKDNIDASLNYEITDATKHIAIKQVGNSLILTNIAQNQSNATNIVNFIPEFKVSIENVGNAQISTLESDNKLQNILKNETYKTSVLTFAKKGTESINVNFSRITIEPLDKISINVNQITDYEQDYLKISFTKITDSKPVHDYFILEHVSGYEFDESNEVFVKTSENGKFEFVFNYEKYVLGNEDYTGIYYITFTADNDVSTTIIVEVVSQQVKNILLKNYYSVLTEVDETKQEEDFVAAGAYSVLQIELYPYFAEYDYVEVLSTSANQNNALIMELVKENENGELEVVYGAEYTTSGVKIPKSVVEKLTTSLTSAKIYVRYTTTSLAEENSKAEIVVRVLKATQRGEEIMFTTSKTINVILKDIVEFSIVNKQKQNNAYYVAKGLTYDLQLKISGFTNEQIVIESTSSYAQITRATNGNYTLQVAKNINYKSGFEGYEMTITTYGAKQVEGLYYTSDKVVMKLIIVDFVVLTDNIKPLNIKKDGVQNINATTIVNNAESGIMRVAIGNSASLGVDLENGVTVEYDMTNASIVRSVTSFTEQLKFKGEWSIVAYKLGIAGEFVKEKVLSGNEFISNDYLRISSNYNSSFKSYEYSLTPLKLASLAASEYHINFANGFKYENGTPLVVGLDDDQAISLSTDIAVEVFATGQENNAIPIETYEDLINMKSGSWYILLSDITLPADHTPLSVDIAGLNGNNKSINFASTWNVSGVSNIGLFSEISANTVIKNLNISIEKNLLVTIDYPTNINFGFIAGKNEGVITNCSVVTNDYVSATVSIIGQQSKEENYAAFVVGQNEGYITNSQVRGTFISNANVAGFVALNENIISSSYVAESKIINKSADISDCTAGFVIKNGVSASSDAKIIGCYVSGEYTTANIYSTGTNKMISSDTQVAGFVFDNYGLISDSYANIPIYSNSIRAGFVFSNAGKISNTYSTSTFGQSGQTAYGFIVENKIDTLTGLAENSFYLLGTVNNSVNKTTISGVRPLNEIDFQLQDIFSSFIFSGATNKTQGIWFYPSLSAEYDFTIDGMAQQFIYGKPELVAANIKAVSEKELDSENIKVDESTGQTSYVYFETKSSEGSIYNPYTISTATEFENLIYSTSTRNINSKYFRLVKDIDYQTEEISSSILYKTVFKGDLEGNGMMLKGYVINSKETLANGGLLAKIGSGTTGEGVVRNLSIAPKDVNLPNTYNVGALAGSLESGSLFNVSALGFENSIDGLVIIGNYCVGGVVGVATNNFKMQNVDSSISARASYDSSLAGEAVGIYTTRKTSQVSYAGAIAGVTNNSGLIERVDVSDGIVSIAEIAGLMFGKIGENVVAREIALILNDNQFIRTSAFGGIVAGELAGTLENVTIGGEMMEEFFKLTPNIPKVVGGVVGFMQEGKISNVNSTVDLIWTGSSPNIIGGIVGEMLSGEIENANFAGDIKVSVQTTEAAVASITVGGIVGKIGTTSINNLTSSSLGGAVSLTDCSTNSDNKAQTNIISVKTESVYRITAGGIVGENISEQKSYLKGMAVYTSLANPLTLNGCENGVDIKIDSIVFDGSYYAYFGGLVGASFLGSEKAVAGEVVIYDRVLHDEINDIMESTSDATLSLTLKNMKQEAFGVLRYGGILGLGTSVSKPTELEGQFVSSQKFGQELVGNLLQEKTAPTYSNPDTAISVPSSSSAINIILDKVENKN